MHVGGHVVLLHVLKNIAIQCIMCACILLHVTQVKHPPIDWKKLGKCQKVITHRPGGCEYTAAAVNSEGLLAVTDDSHSCVHLLTEEGKLVRSIGTGVFIMGCGLVGVAFDLKGNVWVTDWGYTNKVVKLSQDGELLQIIDHAHTESDRLSRPSGIAVSPEGLIYICDRDKHRVTVHGEDGKFLSAFGSKGSGSGRFDRPRGIAIGSDGLVYVVDAGNKKVCAWTKEGSFKRSFKPKHTPLYIAATSDNHLLITSPTSRTIMVYTLRGELVHEFGGKDSHTGRSDELWGICIGTSGLVYVADLGNRRVLVF